MSSRDQQNYEHGESSDFRIVEVVMTTKDQSGKRVSLAQTLLVGNDPETVKYVQENMDDFVKNVVQMKHLEESDSRRSIDENALFFEECLEPLFDLLKDRSGRHLLYEMSASLKRALIDLAMEKFHGDTRALRDIFGLSGEELQKILEECHYSSK